MKRADLPHDTRVTIWSLHRQGHGQDKIARWTGIAEAKVKKLLKGKPPAVHIPREVPKRLTTGEKMEQINVFE